MQKAFQVESSAWTRNGLVPICRVRDQGMSIGHGELGEKKWLRDPDSATIWVMGFNCSVRVPQTTIDYCQETMNHPTTS